jgi:hypothetical protein
LATSVRAFFSSSPGYVVHAKLKSVPNTNYEPLNIMTKKKRKEVA